MTLLKKPALTLVMASFLLTPPVQAQDIGIDNIDPHIIEISFLYGASSYALGANLECDIFRQGELRALNIMVVAAREELTAVAGKMHEQKFNKFSEADLEWKGCLTRSSHPQQWRLIDGAEILTSALIAAPATMKKDPAECRVAGENRAFERKVWQYAGDVMKAKYAQSPYKAEFDKYLNYFASQLDMECFYGKRGALLLQPAFEYLRERDETAMSVNNYLPFTPKITAMVLDKVSLRTPDEHSGWRSRQGGFVSTRVPVNFGVYRMAGRGDQNPISVPLLPATGSGPKGSLFVSKQGHWSARFDGNVTAIRIQLRPNSFIPMNKIARANPSTSNGSEFALADDAQKLLDAQKASHLVVVQFQDSDGNWNGFSDLKRNNDGDPLRMVDIRAALLWVNVPIVERGEPEKSQ